MTSAATADPASLYEKHRSLLEAARQACAARSYWSPYPDMPGKYPDADRAREAGLAAFTSHHGARFALAQAGVAGSFAASAQEVSPYTRAALGTVYEWAPADALFDAAEAAMPAWAAASPEARLGVLMEVLDTLYREHLFELTYAVMHTTGQSFNMAYAGSGVNALDRGIEALVYAGQAMENVPRAARWERDFGKTRVRLDKRYRITPRGIAVCFTCASFPTWNAWPSMMASLATGNPVIVKPHPATVLPMAISVRVFRQVLAAAGFDPNLVCMVLDTPEAPAGKTLVKHPKTAIVDFTGGVRFGRWVEQNAWPAISFTETAGCNTVVLESAADLDAALRSLATTLCLFSAQMCTSPQNIYVPRRGVETPAGLVSFDEIARRLAAAVRELTEDPKKASMILAAIQSDATLASMDKLAQDGAAGGEILLRPAPYAHPEYPSARTSTPLMIKVDKKQRALYAEERFGPISFVVACDDAEDALRQATADVRAEGGLTAFLYSTDERYVARAEDAYARAGAQLTINQTGPMPLNFAAAYSDYHVTGLNPAGNASLTDLAFVAGRFRITQSRRPAA
ncbi:phenylacetic acid degradation protein PaaN [Pigmentiphaga daeguensis]|uniref:Phenylacetic acid degradation protein PaaN n=1 Tax=Pigmentiphaga daeguensis TaxID=414049 RepID=A0ABN1BS07_9BURK